MAQLIKADGTVKEFIPVNGKDFKLKELQTAVGGYIEVVNAANNKIMVVNEEGLLNNLPMNVIATAMVGNPIVGDVVICSENEDGEMVP